MMIKPALIVMAAGIGSRYGGLKQVAAVGAHGESLMEYSLFDAKRAGFEEVVFIISSAMEHEFPQYIMARIGNALSVRCVVQALEDIPDGFAVPSARVRPWGTGHAVLAARHMIKGPFAVINADDYYGPTGFSAIYQFLTDQKSGDQNTYAMVGYLLANTLSENGHVARGICRTDMDGWLAEIKERTHIISTPEGIQYIENGESFPLSADTLASMNLWGLPESFIAELETRFALFLERTLSGNALGGEYFLPDVIGDILREGRASVRVLPCGERWYGMTYPKDRPVVAEAISRMTENGLYPQKLWS